MQAITFSVGFPKRNVQIVLRLYSTAADVLASFDVDSCCVAFDGSQLWASPRAQRALNTRSNTIDLSRRSTTYESRLVKYAFRGFSLAVPPDLMCPARVSPACFDAPTKYEKALLSLRGLARCIALDRLFEQRRRRATPKTIKVDGTDVELIDALGPGAYWGEQFSPVLLDENDKARTTGRNYTNRFPVDERNIAEAMSLSCGKEQVDVPEALYGGGREAIPWRSGYDARRLEHHIKSLRKKIHFDDDDEPILSPAKAVASRTAVLPSEDMINYGYEVSKLISTSTLIRNRKLACFFPVSAAGWTDNVHCTEPALQLCRIVVLRLPDKDDTDKSFVHVYRTLVRLSLLPADIVVENSHRIRRFFSRMKRGFVLCDAAPTSAAEKLAEVLKTDPHFRHPGAR